MLNKLIVQGRLVKDPELKSTPQGTSVVSFCIAVDRDFVSSNGERETDFLNAVAWRGTAEFISRHFRKGNLILLVGRMQTRDWKEKDGSTRKSVEIYVEDAHFCESLKSAQVNALNALEAKINELNELNEPGDLPF